MLPTPGPSGLSQTPNSSKTLHVSEFDDRDKAIVEELHLEVADHLQKKSLGLLFVFDYERVLSEYLHAGSHFGIEKYRILAGTVLN
jgi:hypothetical protein